LAFSNETALSQMTFGTPLYHRVTNLDDMTIGLFFGKLHVAVIGLSMTATTK